MNKLIFSHLVVLTVSIGSLLGQDPVFTVTLQHDTVKLGEVFSVEFQLKNAQGSFEAPEMTNFTVIGGPNYASSYQMINGETTISMTYSYYLQASEPGEWFIGPASVALEDDIIETAPVKVVVVDDPSYQKPKTRMGQPTRPSRKKGMRL